MYFLVSLDVDVDSEHADGFRHDERQCARVEGPTVAVLVLLVFSFLVTGVANVARDVHDDAYDVAQTWGKKKLNIPCTMYHVMALRKALDHVIMVIIIIIIII